MLVRMWIYFAATACSKCMCRQFWPSIPVKLDMLIEYSRARHHPFYCELAQRNLAKCHRRFSQRSATDPHWTPPFVHSHADVRMTSDFDCRENSRIFSWARMISCTAIAGIGQLRPLAKLIFDSILPGKLTLLRR